MKRFGAYLFAILAGCSAVGADLDVFFGTEDWARSPSSNTSQTWIGLQYTSDHTIWNHFRPYARLMLGLKDEDPYLVSTGLSFAFQPVSRIEDLYLAIQTGPAYTDVGPPHTGQRWNWMTDVRLGYKFVFIGYSHTSNAGLDDTNKGLDMFTCGISVPLGKRE